VAVLKDRIAMNPTTDLSRAFLASALGHLGRSKRRARSGASSRRSILDTRMLIISVDCRLENPQMLKSLQMACARQIWRSNCAHRMTGCGIMRKRRKSAT
jgi:hypothetical protein